MIAQDELKELLLFSKSLRILYVEDNLEAREQALKLLMNFFGDIVTSVDGKDGLEEFKKDKLEDNNTFDLIFTDLNMPVMNGLDMIKKIREIDKSIPVVVVSAHNELSFQEDAKKHNIEKYIIKPVSLDEIIDILVILRARGPLN